MTKSPESEMARPGPLSVIPPLAEGRWLWRRIYVFAISTGLWLLLAGVVRSAAPQTLPRIAEGLLSLQALVLVVYLVAPTTQQLIELMANLRLRLGGGR